MKDHIKQKLIDLGVDLTKPLGVAVSGGVDSMVLLYYLHALGVRLKAYHMEHGIRGQQSLGDMDFVKEQCKNLGIECITKQVDIPKLAQKNCVSVETAARQARYEFLDGADVEFIATAHHMDDLAETVLMNLTRGSGLAGLCGIPERRGKYIRPMLGISRSEIEEYADKHNIKYVVDSTNEDTSYTRNYIRKEILPRLKEINEAAVQNIARTSGLLREDEHALISTASNADCIEFVKNEAAVDLEVFAQQSKAVKKRILRLAVAGIFDLVDVENVHLDSIINLIENGVSGKTVNLKYGLFASIAYGKLIIGKTDEKGYNYSLVALPETGNFAAGAYEFECETLEPQESFEFSSDAEIFDAETVKGSVLRTRLEGDFIVPLGMKGTKRLSDYLSDRKVPLYKRDDLLVMARGSEVYWAVGVGVSEVSKVIKNRSILKIKYREREYAE